MEFTAHMLGNHGLHKYPRDIHFTVVVLLKDRPAAELCIFEKSKENVVKVKKKSKQDAIKFRNQPIVSTDGNTDVTFADDVCLRCVIRTSKHTLYRRPITCRLLCSVCGLSLNRSPCSSSWGFCALEQSHTFKRCTGSCLSAGRAGFPHARSCTVCGSEFSWKGALRAYDQHTFKFKCSKCCYVFADVSSLSQHCVREHGASSDDINMQIILFDAKRAL